MASRSTWCRAPISLKSSCLIPQLGVHDRVNGKAPSRATHILMIVVRDTGSVLVYAHDRGIDHLHRRVMTGRQRIYDPVPAALRIFVHHPKKAFATISAG